VIEKGPWLYGLRKNSISQKQRKMYRARMFWKRSARLDDGFATPKFCPFAIHSEFFRSLFNP